jgi:putative ABC transport system permease protein
MSNWLQDLRYGARTLRKSPAFTAAAIFTLALGIGANSAIFTLIDAVLLRPLPFPHPDRLALVWEETTIFGLKDSPVALGNYAVWRAENHVFGEMGALEQTSFRLTAGGEAQQLQGSIATAGLFRALGVQPALGRLFRDSEDQPGAPKVVLLSDELWRSRFGGQASTIGSTVTINDEKCTVVGVMPAGFRFPDIENELWMPLGSYYKASAFSDRGRHNFMVVARLLPGASLARANQEIRAIAARMEHDYPDTNAKVGAFVAPLREHFAGEHRGELLVLGCAVGFVLLIACANITNLLLSRATNRKREMAVRAALGASRGRIVRQLFTENLLLSAAGGGCGLAIAVYGVRLLQFLVPSGIAGMRPVTVDLRILGFTFAVALLTGVLVGLAPALELLRTDIQRMLKQGGGRAGTGHGARGVERALVITEVALAFVLTLGAALMLQAFARLRGVDTGFRSSHLLTLRTPLSRAKYGELAKMNAYYDEVLRRVTALPGVVSAGFANHIPIAFKGDVNGFEIEGRPDPRPGEFTNADWRIVTPDYLRTLGIPLRQGRCLDRRDAAEAPSVLLVNETMARQYWPNENAVGKRIRMGPDWSTIVGVVGDIKTAGLDVPSQREMYLPAAQVPRAATSLAIHTRGDPAKLAAAVVREIHAVDPGVPVLQVSTMEEILDREVFGRRMQTTLLASFAAVALLLAALGIYGVLAYAVAQRTQEIGVRMALGARPADVLRQIAGQGMGWSAMGILIGAAGGLGLTRMLSKMLFEVSATDPATFAGAAALLLAVAWTASYIPARRAMKLDPIVALREE